MRRLTLTAALALALAATAAGGQPRLRGMNFFSNCYFSHISPDDPIVYPRQPGVSHSHTFFGATTTNASSTIASLRGSPTTCRRAGDTAAYWVPTLFADGAPVKPTKGSAYFVLHAREMHAFPAGLKIVAGDAHARTPQSLEVTYWSCSMLEGTRWQTPRPCPTPRRSDRPSLLQLDVIFPDCWDGRHLDSADHKSHMAYSRKYTCPPSHPVKVPRLRFIVTYPISEPKNLALASGGVYSGHADFVNAWNQAALVDIVRACFEYTPRCNLPPTTRATRLDLSARWLDLKIDAVHIRGRLTSGGHPLGDRAVTLSASDGHTTHVLAVVRTASDGSYGLHVPVVSDKARYRYIEARFRGTNQLLPSHARVKTGLAG
jgi:hypothetical protein